MILFTADWCPHCQKVKQWLSTTGLPMDTFGVEHDPTDPAVYICDVDKDFDTPTHYGVKQLPALVRTDDSLMVESSDIIQYIKDEMGL